MVNYSGRPPSPGVLLDSIHRLHADRSKFVLAITGGGVSAIANLLVVPGASNTILESLVPYHPRSLEDFLGFQPQQACSADTARALAMQAYRRARRLAPEDDVFGLGGTAALTTNRHRRGQDRCFVAIQSDGVSIEFNLTLDKQLDRADQESICSQLVVDAMLFGAGLNQQFESGTAGYRLQAADLEWQGLMRGDSRSTLGHSSPPAALFPGAFNPPHDGHLRMHELAEQITGQQVVLEISTENVDKPPLDFFDMARRRSLLKNLPLVFTRAATFVEKSRLFPGALFVVGVDTMQRIADPFYYHGSATERDLAIELLVENQHRFLVFGRLGQTGYETLRNLDIPRSLQQICDEVSEADFRSDLSSSELRMNH